nr:SWIM zinc finger family protein [Natronomonas aquatica]
MNVDRETIRNRSSDAVFERGENYRDERRIQRLDRFDDLVTAAVSGSNLYDVTVDFSGRGIDTRCTCPYDGGGDCKHVVAVLPRARLGRVPSHAERSLSRPYRVGSLRRPERCL